MKLSRIYWEIKMGFEDYYAPFVAPEKWIAVISSGFENMVVSVLISSYYDMISAGNYERDWHEVRFSAALIGYMQKTRDKKKLDLLIDPEQYLYNDDILNGINDPSKAPRIDIRTHQNWMKEDVFYPIEGKVLVEKNWKTRNASSLRKRYISTGIENFTNGKYGAKGVIAGFVVEGNPKAIVKQINELMQTQGYSPGCCMLNAPFNGYDNHYKSIHNCKCYVELRHILFDFTLQN